MTVCLSVLCIMIGKRWRRVWGTRPWSYGNMNVISISNTPHASRSPALPLDLISDQFAYRPTASTTAALISLTHAVAQKLGSCNYVRCLQIDYAKAFDMINHPILQKTYEFIHPYRLRFSVGYFSFLQVANRQLFLVVNSPNGSQSLVV